MSSMTMEQVTEVPVGASIHLAGVEWERTERGYKRNEFDVPLTHFEKMLPQVRRHQPVALESVWMDGDHLYLVTAPPLADEPGFWWVAVFESQTYRHTIRLQEASLGEPVTLPVGWLTEEKRVMAVEIARMHQTNRVQTLAGQQGRVSLDGYKREVQEALHEYLSSQGGLTHYEREGLHDILTELDLEQPSREVDVRIAVTGTYSCYMDSAMSEAVGGGVSVDMPMVEIEWSKTVRSTVTVQGTDDVGDMVDESLVGSLLREEGVSWDSFEFEVYEA